LSRATLPLPRHASTHAVLVVIIPLLILIILTSYHDLLMYPLANTSGVNAVGVSNDDILVDLRNGTIYEVHADGFQAFSTLIVNDSTVIALGTFKGHPALLVLITNYAHAYATLYYLPAYTGALFSGATHKGFGIVGVGYVAFNNTYAGVVMRASLRSMDVVASVYVFSIPVYFRDIIIHGSEILVAAGVGLGGRYYPALTMISGSDARLIALNPSVGGLKGFTVKAAVLLQGGEPAVLAMREGNAVLVKLTGGKLRAYTLTTERRFEDVVLVTHPNDIVTTVILNGTAPAVIMFPYVNITLLPLASRYYLLTINGSVLVLGPNYRTLPVRWKSSRIMLKNLSLEGFNILKYVARGRRVSVSTSEALISIEVIKPSISGTLTTTHPLTSLNTTSNQQTRVTHTTTAGFTLIGSGERNGLLLIIIGCVLVFASFLLKKFLGV